MVSDWQKDYESEAKGIIKKSVEEYDDMVRMSNITAAKMCECGIHQTENKLRFCKHCKRSFCREHGDMDKSVCDECDDLRKPIL